MSIALREWVRPLLYCEIDPYCQAVLLNRQLDDLLPRAPIWDDITNLRRSGDKGDTDIIYGGFPCQDISIAGRGEGLAGKRSGLFYEILRLLRETGSRFLFLENVPAITGRGGADIVREITSLGYDCRWCIISAESVGAKHKRERWFLLAHSQGQRCEGSRDAERTEEGQPQSTLPSMDDNWAQDQPMLVGMADAVPNRMDRTRALGNAVVPRQAKEAFKILMGY